MSGDEARALANKAVSLVDPEGRNLVEVGQIALRFKLDESLPEMDGAKNFQAWLAQRFGKKKRTVMRAVRIVEHLGADVKAEDLLAIGIVKGELLARLPESIRRDKAAKWVKQAREKTVAEFKAAVSAALNARGPQHEEEYYTFQVTIALAAKVIRDQALAIAGKLNEQDGMGDGRSVKYERIFAEFVATNQEHGVDAVSEEDSTDGEQ